MAQNPPAAMPRLTPYLFYEDVAAALDWLTRAFGWEERMRIPGPDGTVGHAEMKLADAVIMMGCPGPDYRSAKKDGHVHQLQYVYVDQIDRHFEQAKAAGANILSEPEDKFYGDRSYVAEDLEGHQWSFAEHTRDPSPEEMQAAIDEMPPMG